MSPFISAIQNGFSSVFFQHYWEWTTAFSLESDSKVINYFWSRKRASNPNVVRITTCFQDLQLPSSLDLTYFYVTRHTEKPHVQKSFQSLDWTRSTGSTAEVGGQRACGNSLSLGEIHTKSHGSGGGKISSKNKALLTILNTAFLTPPCNSHSLLPLLTYLATTLTIHKGFFLLFLNNRERHLCSQPTTT